MTDADLRALCARVARDAVPGVNEKAVNDAPREIRVYELGGPYRYFIGLQSAGPDYPTMITLPLSVPYADADALAAALYDAAKAQGAAEGGPSQVAADTEGGKR